MSILFLFALACSSKDSSIYEDIYSPEENSSGEEDFTGSHWAANLHSNPTISSSQLDIHWNIPENENISLFQLEIIEQSTNTSEILLFDPSQSHFLIENRKAQTLYAINIEACLDEACSLRLSAQENRLETETEEQRWLVEGSSLETMSILAENITEFSVGSFDYQMSELGEQLWTYSFGSLNSYSQTENDSWETPLAYCWDESCFSNIQQFQLNGSFMWILDSANTIHKQNSEDIDSCSQDCNSEVLFSSDDDSLRDFFFTPDLHILFWEGTSNCQEEAIFLSSSSDEVWRTQLDTYGCPKAISSSSKSPRLVSTAQHDLLYFQKMGQIHYLYAKDTNLVQWEPEEETRSLILEWDDGTEIGLDDFRIGSMAFDASDLMYFSFQAPDISSEQYSTLSVATLINP